MLGAGFCGEDVRPSGRDGVNIGRWELVVWDG